MKAKTMSAKGAFFAILFAGGCTTAAAPGVSYVRARTTSLPSPAQYLVIEPPSYARSPSRRYPVLVFLHDGYGNVRTPDRRGVAAELTARMSDGRLPEFLVVAPGAPGSWFSDSFDGKRRWEEFLTGDLLREIQNRYRVLPGKAARGITGISMGGYRAIYLSALDERIAAACVTGFMSTVKPMIKAHIDTHSWVHFLPGLHAALDLPDVASLAAPRALLVQQCSRDRLFPLAGMKESVEKIAAVYKKAGAGKQFAGRFHDVPHQFTRKMQDEAFAWLDEHL